ncbi:MAG TPA: hypothetical protein VFA66_06960 [Gaiellaceae bacterium]|nr:hypothetical protein [Gaiellaceae bacterium]
MRKLIAAAIAAATASTPALCAGAATRPFDAQFHDKPCGPTKLCGTGVLAGFGAVTTELVVTPVGPGPAPGCTLGKGTRTLTLAKDSASRLRLAVQGPLCGARAFGTFSVVSGTGVFAHARGGGVILGPPLALRYYGVLALG